MKKLIEIFKGKNKMAAMMNLLALSMVIQTVNSTCFWIHHQPKVPDSAKKYRRF